MNNRESLFEIGKLGKCAEEDYETVSICKCTIVILGNTCIDTSPYIDIYSYLVLSNTLTNSVVPVSMTFHNYVILYVVRNCF